LASPVQILASWEIKFSSPARLQIYSKLAPFRLFASRLSTPRASVAPRVVSIVRFFRFVFPRVSLNRRGSCPILAITMTPKNAGSCNFRSFGIRYSVFDGTRVRARARARTAKSDGTLTLTLTLTLTPREWGRKSFAQISISYLFID